jgi:hypothetical protein
MRKIFFILLLLSLVFSCRKASDRKCWKSAGPYAEKVIQLGDFNRLFLKEHLRYTLIQDSTNQIIIKGGANMIDWIEVNGEVGLVSILSKNKCNFFRKYAVVDVEIHYTSIINIIFEGTESLTCSDTMKTNYLALTLRDGAGSMHMLVDAIDIRTDLTHGWGDMTIAGKTHTSRYQLTGDGFIDATDLHVRDSISFISYSSTIQKINADNCKLKSEINGIGDIWYYGVPTSIYNMEYGKGRLINKN